MVIVFPAEHIEPRSFRKPLSAEIQTLEQLKRHLGVTMIELNTWREIIHSLASEHMDVNMTFTEQDPTVVKAFKAQILEHIPELEDFDEAWPINVIIKTWFHEKRRRPRFARRLPSTKKHRGTDNSTDNEKPRSVVVKQEDLAQPMTLRKRHVHPNRAYVDLSACSRPASGSLAKSAFTSSSLLASSSSASASSSSSSAPAPSYSASASRASHSSYAVGGTRQGSGSNPQLPSNNPPSDPTRAVKDWLAFHGIEALYPQFAEAGIKNSAKLGFSISWSTERRRKLFNRIMGMKEITFYQEAQLKVALGL
ncbi:hypothetical protein JAAARDRAFT_81947 [Jaapia argillacea MUCL 33604]|uniref:Uncharacterized protein n=1 Tax=Jaapia argillacea MUCL 33604 TaxID=933084 RepID=A0A067P982_9AGAM|nr:hypothetical protein JAAARDRAFT_81947 [Jaapia argillacea MUCL 33604]